METMQRLMKKNNKGFSLVELIVVILIIGILAVAIAPQVTKWVGTATTNQASNEIATLQSAVQVALADYEGDGGELTKDVTVTIPSGTGNITVTDGATAKLATKLNEVITNRPKVERKFTITTEGAVTPVK